MIAIDVTLSPIAPDLVPGFDFTKQFINQSHTDIAAFFKKCIDLKIILNTVTFDESPALDITRYYAVSLANAQEFINQWENTARAFSMKKFWADTGYTATFTTSEVDFELVENPGILVSEFGELWGWTFPV